MVDLTKIEKLVETLRKQPPVHQEHIDPIYWVSARIPFTVAGLLGWRRIRLWLHFPLFDIEVVFGIGVDKRIINARLLSVGLGIVAICIILTTKYCWLAPIKGVCPGLMST